jgi:hypothetical protein
MPVAQFNEVPAQHKGFASCRQPGTRKRSADRSSAAENVVDPSLVQAWRTEAGKLGCPYSDNTLGLISFSSMDVRSAGLNATWGALLGVFGNT